MNLGVQNGAKMGIRIQTMKPRDDISKLAPRAPKTNTQWGECFSKHLWVAIVIIFWLNWAGYLAVAGLNLLAQVSYRISPFGV